jgi:hypothetical protein
MAVGAGFPRFMEDLLFPSRVMAVATVLSSPVWAGLVGQGGAVDPWTTAKESAVAHGPTATTTADQRAAKLCDLAA